MHECFKFIAEAVFTNAFVVERPDGSIGAYNCTAERLHDGGLKVTASEPQIATLYTNLLSRHINVSFDGEVKKINN